MATTDRVLYLSYDGLTDPLGQSQILPYIIGLSSKGFQFTIISFEKENRDMEHKNSISRICQQNDIIWIPLPYHKNPPVVSTLYDLWLLKKTVDEIIQRNRISILHCRSYPTSLVGLAAKRKWGVKFIFDMRGFWADERVEGALWDLNNPFYKLIYRYFKKKEREFLREADYVISLTQNAKSEIESWGIKTLIAVIPTCVDLQLFDPTKISNEETRRLKDELKIHDDDFVLLYLGSWGTWYLTQDMLRFFALIRTHIKAKFLIISTDVVDLTGYPDANDVIVRSVTRAQVPSYITLASAAVAFIKSSFSKKASSATKIGELMAMGTFTISNAGWGDIEQLSSENILVLPDLSFETMNAGVTRMLRQKNRGNSSDMKSHPLSLINGILKYESVYGQIVR